MISFLIGFLAFLNAFFHSRYSLGLEILDLRQQLRVLKRKRPNILASAPPSLAVNSRGLSPTLFSCSFTHPR
jgi:hypothetical protein